MTTESRNLRYAAKLVELCDSVATVPASRAEQVAAHYEGFAEAIGMALDLEPDDWYRALVFAFNGGLRADARVGAIAAYLDRHQGTYTK